MVDQINEPAREHLDAVPLEGGTVELLESLTFYCLYPRCDKSTSQGQPTPNIQQEARPASQKEEVQQNSSAIGLTQHLQERTKLQQAGEEQMALTMLSLC